MRDLLEHRDDFEEPSDDTEGEDQEIRDMEKDTMHEKNGAVGGKDEHGNRPEVD